MTIVFHCSKIIHEHESHIKKSTEVVIMFFKGAQRKVLNPEEKPCAEFVLTDDDEFIAAFAYCNLHGLWKSE